MAKQENEVQAKIEGDSKKSSDSLNIDKMPRNPIGVIGTFLQNKEINQLSKVNNKFYFDLKTQMAKRKVEEENKKKAIELLYIVLNNPCCILVQVWLEKNKSSLLFDTKSIALIRTKGKEGYYSEKIKDMRYKREWGNISALEAAAISGDNFLVQTLLSSIPDHQKYEAGLQLQKIRHLVEYLKPFQDLQKAYQTFIETHSKLTAEGKWDELETLDFRIGMFIKWLPTYGLQEYCDDKPFNPIPDFNKEPRRSCLSSDSFQVNLDLVVGRDFIFYKAPCGLGMRWFPHAERLAIYKLELAAIKHLCELRTAELDNHIETLLKFPPESLTKANSIGDKENKELNEYIKQQENELNKIQKRIKSK